MILRGVEWRRLLRYVPVALVVAGVGLLHRAAACDAWADDRLLASEPAWWQLGAPLWHATVGDTASVANGLAYLVDRLSSASTAGDTRALAAVLVALGAGALFVLLRRAEVPHAVALPLSFSTVAYTLPISTATSAAHALQLLLGVGLLLAWSAPRLPPRQRVGLLSAITLVGTLNHASFLAYAAPIWVVLWSDSATADRIHAAGVGLAALGASLAASAWLLYLPVSGPTAIPTERPGPLAIAFGLVTGRFADDLQPLHHVGLLSAAALCLPGPWVLCLPLAALGFARRETRRIAVALGSAAGALWLFTSGTWLPDPTVACVPARLAVVLLIGLGLSWIAAQHVRGAMMLAVAAGALVGLNGFIDRSRWSAPFELARFGAFVEAATAAVDDGAWVVDRLAVGRGLLRADPILGGSRLPARPDLLRVIPEDRSVVVLGVDDTRPVDAAVWAAPLDLPHPSVSTFLSSRPARTWMALAVSGATSGTWCQDLLVQLGVRLRTASRSATDAPLAVLARIGTGEPRAPAIGREGLDVPYGQALGRRGEPVPARFTIETDPVIRIAVNGEERIRATKGLAFVVLDPWSLRSRTWRVESCDEPALPPIRDPRLGAGYLVDNGAPRRTPIGQTIAADAVRVRLGTDGEGWFGSGWHSPEGPDEEAFRWTSARDAQVNVVVSRRQPLRVRLTARLAETATQPNALALSWNGRLLRPLGPWDGSTEGTWTIPATQVRRGLNTLTIHVARVLAPASDSDPRALGAMITRLSFEPITSRGARVRGPRDPPRPIDRARARNQ